LEEDSTSVKSFDESGAPSAWSAVRDPREILILILWPTTTSSSSAADRRLRRCAIRAAQLGKKSPCVEKEARRWHLLNWGCIPTKALLKNAELYHTMAHRAAEFGFKVEGVSYDWGKIIKRSRDVSDKNAAGIEYLFKKNKVDYVRGEASMEKAGQREGEGRRRKGGDPYRAQGHHRDRLRLAADAGFPIQWHHRDRLKGSDDPREAAKEHGNHRRRSDRR
jgi:hypothetical protein